MIGTTKLYNVNPIFVSLLVSSILLVKSGNGCHQAWQRIYDQQRILFVVDSQAVLLHWLLNHSMSFVHVLLLKVNHGWVIFQLHLGVSLSSGVTTAPADPAMQGGPWGLGGPPGDRKSVV